MTTVSEDIPAHLKRGTVTCCSYGIFNCGVHEGHLRCGIYLQNLVTDADAEIDLDYHTTFAENVDDDTLQSISMWSLIDRTVALKKAQDFMFPRVKQTLRGKHIQPMMAMTRADEYYVSNICSGSMCWSIKPKTRVNPPDSENSVVPSVFFCSTTIACPIHVDHQKVIGVFRTNINDQTVKESIHAKLRVSSLDPEVRSAIWRTDRTQARFILEEHLFASVTSVLRRKYGPNTLDSRVKLMIPPPSDVAILKTLTENCDGSDCSIQDTNDQNTASAPLSQLQLGEADGQNEVSLSLRFK